jgi:hypothetical protein
MFIFVFNDQGESKWNIQLMCNSFILQYSEIKTFPIKSEIRFLYTIREVNSHVTLYKRLYVTRLN